MIHVDMKNDIVFSAHIIPINEKDQSPLNCLQIIMCNNVIGIADC